MISSLHVEYENKTFPFLANLEGEGVSSYRKPTFSKVYTIFLKSLTLELPINYIPSLLIKYLACTPAICMSINLKKIYMYDYIYMYI